MQVSLIGSTFRDSNTIHIHGDAMYPSTLSPQGPKASYWQRRKFLLAGSACAAYGCLVLSSPNRHDILLEHANIDGGIFNVVRTSKQQHDPRLGVHYVYTNTHPSRSQGILSNTGELSQCSMEIITSGLSSYVGTSLKTVPISTPPSLVLLVD